MAAKKEVAAEVIPEEKMAGMQAETDEWAEEIEMLVPRKKKGDDPTFYVCVNDRRFMIPADGKMQKLPKPVALVLQESLAAEADAEDYADHMPNKAI